MADPLLTELPDPSTTAPAPSMEEQQLGGLLGQAASFAFGAGRSASMGLSDLALSEAANLVGGESARQDMLRGLNVAKQVNPYTSMAGEAAGLFVGGGKAITAAGEGVEGLVASRLGEGLGGSIASMGARGAVEGAAMGVGSAISESVLGDTDVTAEKLFAHMGKDALIGGGIGAGLGALAYGGRRALDAVLTRTKGPTPGGVLDEVAGVEGGGAALKSEAEGLQKTVGELRAAGATEEQAARLADEVGDLAKAKLAGGPAADKLDDVAEAFIQKRAGGDAEMADALRKAYIDRAKGLATHEDALEQAALKMADKGTRVMRNLEDTANEVQFSYKSEQMAKLVDASKVNAQANRAAEMLQDVDQVLATLEGTFTKGGAEVGVSKIRKAYKDVVSKMTSLGDEASLAARENVARDLFVAMDDLKKSVGRSSQFGSSTFKGAQPEAVIEFQALYDRLKVGLEDAEVWGRAGQAQARWNQTFSSMFPRRQEFGKRFAVAIDQEAGILRPELDPSKIKGYLRSLESEADSKVSRETIEQVISGSRDRAAAIKEFGDLTPRQQELLEQGLKDLGEFEASHASAIKDAQVANKIRSLQLEEKEKALGGIIGLAADVVSRPLTTIERLAAMRATTQRVEKAIEGGLTRFFGGSGQEVVQALTRPKAEVAKEIDAIREVATKPEALTSRVRSLVGDLPEYAPRTAAAMNTVAMRAMTYLASEAPQPRVGITLGNANNAKTRYSDSQLTAFENKAQAVKDPASVVEQMRAGRLNRDGIRAVEVVYPQLFAQMQDMARDHIQKLAASGKLDNMPRQQQAAIATLLKVPPSELWTADFMALMQGAKAMPTPTTPGTAPQPAPVAKRPIKVNTALFETEAQQIEGRTTT